MRLNVLFGKRKREKKGRGGEGEEVKPAAMVVVCLERLLGSTTKALGCLNSLAMHDAPHQEQDTMPPQISSSCRRLPSKGDRRGCWRCEKGEATAALPLGIASNVSPLALHAPPCA